MGRKMKQCPYCGETFPDAETKCPKCGKEENMNASQESDSKNADSKNKKRKRFIIPVAIIAAVAVLLVVFWPTLSSLFGRVGQQEHIFYIMDGQLKVSDLTGEDKSEVTSELGDGEYTTALNGTLLSEDGRYLYYQDRVEDDGTFTLYCRDLQADNSKTDSAIKIDSGIDDFTSISIPQDGKLVFYMKDGNLYRHDHSEKIKVDGDVSDYRISSDGTRVVSMENDGTIYTIDNKENKEKIVTEATELVYVSDDAAAVSYISDGNLYNQTIGEERKKISEDVSGAFTANGKDFYISKEGEDTKLSFSNYFEDDVNDNENMEEPVIEDYQTQETITIDDNFIKDFLDKNGFNAQEWENDYNTRVAESNYYSLYYYSYSVPYTASFVEYAIEELEVRGIYPYDIIGEYIDEKPEYEGREIDIAETEDFQYNVTITDQVAYDEAVAKFEGGDARNKLREQIASAELAIINAELYYYDGEQEKLLDQNVSALYTISENIMIYGQLNFDKTRKVKMSELSQYTLDEVFSIYQNIVADEGKYTVKAALNGTATEIDQNDALSFFIPTSENSIYYINNYNAEERTGTLQKIPVTAGSFGASEVIAENVGKYGISGDGSVIYFTDMKDNHGELYKDGEHIDTDVYAGFVGRMSDGKLAYLIDYSDKNGGDLKIGNAENGEVIATDVYSELQMTKGGQILYFNDYAVDKGKGTLMCYSGESVHIDDDASRIVLPLDINEFKKAANYSNLGVDFIDGLHYRSDLNYLLMNPEDSYNLEVGANALLSLTSETETSDAGGEEANSTSIDGAWIDEEFDQYREAYIFEDNMAYYYRIDTDEGYSWIGQNWGKHPVTPDGDKWFIQYNDGASATVSVIDENTIEIAYDPMNTSTRLVRITDQDLLDSLRQEMPNTFELGGGDPGVEG